MLNGVLVAYAIILAAIPIPIVHFIALPIAPFAAGFVGGGIAKADEGRIITFGLIVAGLALIPAVAMLLLGLVFDVEIANIPTGLLVFAGFALVPYVWFGVTMGALISYAFRQKEAKETKGASQPASRQPDSRTGRSSGA